MQTITGLNKLGVGINYCEKVAKLLTANPGIVDYIEYSPDTLCTELVEERSRKFALNAESLATAKPFFETYPAVVHGLGLSIGSASGWNPSYIQLLSEFQTVKSFEWHSEHLGFSFIEMENGEQIHAGTLLPVPFTEESLDVICPRIKLLQKRFDKPFLIENTTYYLPEMKDNAWDEVGFLNEIMWSTGCGLLLDIYNFYCNAKNFNFDPYKALSKLNMDGVVEIHIAGGVTHETFMLDVHSQVVSEEIWTLLEWVLARAPNVCAITYEVLDEAVDRLGEAEIAAQLRRAKKVWDNYQSRLASSHSRKTADTYVIA